MPPRDCRKRTADVGMPNGGITQITAVQPRLGQMTGGCPEPPLGFLHTRHSAKLRFRELESYEVATGDLALRARAAVQSSSPYFPGRASQRLGKYPSKAVASSSDDWMCGTILSGARRPSVWAIQPVERTKS